MDPIDPCLMVFMPLSNPLLLSVGVTCDLPLTGILQRQWAVTSVIPLHRTLTSILLSLLCSQLVYFDEESVGIADMARN